MTENVLIMAKCPFPNVLTNEVWFVKYDAIRIWTMEKNNIS